MDEKTKQKTYDMLLIRASYDSGERFRTELAEALEKGFPIDYIPPIVKGKKAWRDTKRTLLHFFIEGPQWRRWRQRQEDMGDNEDYYDSVRFMLNNGADVNIRDKRGKGQNVLQSALWNREYLYMPVDVFRDIVAKTEAFSHIGSNKNYENMRQNALKMLINDIISPEGTDIWEKIIILIDAGADYNIDETEYHEVYREKVNEIKNQIAEYIEYRETLQNLEDKDHDLYENLYER